MSRSRGLLVRYAIFVVTGLVAIPVVASLFHVFLSLVFIVLFAVVFAGAGLFASELGMESDLPQPQEPQRQVPLRYGGSAWMEAERLRRSNSESGSQSQADHH